MFMLALGTLVFAGLGWSATGVPAGIPLSDSEGSTQATVDVAVFDFQFEDEESGTPVTVIGAGNSVRFVFTQGIHTATTEVDALGGFDSGIKRPSDEDPTHTVRFTDTGVFKYRCELHPALMHGTIVVV